MWADCRRTYVLPRIPLLPLGRPTYTSAYLHFTTDSLFLCFFFLFSPNLRARWTELNQNRPHARKQLQFENACPKSAVSPLNRWPKNHPFGRLCNLTANLTAYVFGMKHDIDNPSSALTTTRSLLHRPECHELGSTKGFKLDRHFTHLCKFCFLRHCHASQTAISKQNSTTLCQTVDGKSR